MCGEFALSQNSTKLIGVKIGIVIAKSKLSHFTDRTLRIECLELGNR